jgi:hypothetical protein
LQRKNPPYSLQHQDVPRSNKFHNLAISLLSINIHYLDLGNILTDYCLEIASKWKLKRFVAQTTTDNKRMINVFKKRGFTISVNDKDSTVDVEKEL